MPNEPLPAFVMMQVSDSAHPRYRQAGRVVWVGGDDEDGRVTEFELEFSDGKRERFTVVQVRLIRSG